MLIIAVLVGVFLGYLYGVLLRTSVRRTFAFAPDASQKKLWLLRLVSGGQVVLFFSTLVRLALFGLAAYVMLRWSVAHLILMLISFMVTLWIFMFIAYKSDNPYVRS